MYRLRPKLKIKEKVQLLKGFQEIFTVIQNNQKKIAVEVYPGIDSEIWIAELKKEFPNKKIINTDIFFKSPELIFASIQQDLTDDPVFGRFSHRNFKEFIDFEKIKQYDILKNSEEQIILVGVCASIILDYDQLIYIDLPRWEIQKRYKAGSENWRGYKEQNFAEKLKRAYYFEWPAADAIKETCLEICDYYIDGSLDNLPKGVTHKDLMTILAQFSEQPFRLVPYFDPGIWGGNWMQNNFKVKQEEVNLAWSFDGVPEENSILASIGEEEIEIPAQNLVMCFPEKLMGSKVFGRYGKDFPIRFDFLDTMDGQNLSLQVHPTLDYAYRNFGAKYTQDESYYIIDCKDDACVYLGVKNGTNKENFVSALKKAGIKGGFSEQNYVNKFSVKKHDHILIPSGTVHSSGKNCVVLEISATPNRFTFKLWDWGRIDLDGKPRPISLKHGEQVINPSFDKTFCEKELINSTYVVHEEEGFTEEHTGLHQLEAIETRRITCDREVLQETCQSVNMLNLIEGEEAIITDAANHFEPFHVFYGETFIIPECVKQYYIAPAKQNSTIKVIKAYIR